MNVDELRKERQDRILNAMHGVKKDRTPLMMAGDNALIRVAKPDTTFRYMIEHHEEMTKTIVDEVLPLYPKLDFLAAVGMSSRFLGAAFWTETLLPGVELADNEMWQLNFKHFMVEDDYDFIINNGWQKYANMILFDRLGYSPEAMSKDFEAGQRNMQLYHDAGLPFAFSGMLSSPFDILAFSRGLEDFFMDLFECPEKVIEVMNIALDEEENSRRDSIIKEIADNKEKGEETLYVVAPCVQANCDLLGRGQFEEFGWPLIKRQADFLLELGAKVRFHMDSNWTRNLDLFTCFPKGTCIFDSDGNTDLEKTRDILSSTMAFTGSVDPALFAFGRPDDIYEVCRTQIECMGDSFILSPSCSIPANAPKENIDAMYAAVED